MHPTRILALLACALPSAAANYSTYIGDAYPYTVRAIAVDGAGNTYITGTRQISLSASLPITTDIFVSKLDAAGNVTLLTTITGKGSDQANAIAVDAAGNIYVAGDTYSPDFPLLHALQTTPASSGATGFLVKLNAAGAMLYSTYLGNHRLEHAERRRSGLRGKCLRHRRNVRHGLPVDRGAAGCRGVKFPRGS